MEGIVRLLGVTLVASCTMFSMVTGRRLAQAPSTSPASTNNYSNVLLAALRGNASASGPILYKTFEAAYFATVAETNISDVQLVDESETYTFGNGSQVLTAWVEDTTYLILAFSVSDKDNTSLTSSVSQLSPISYLSDFFGGSPPAGSPIAVSIFHAVIGNLSEADGFIDRVTSGGNSSAVGRVLCTGWGGGAALAQLCGPWAQITYPAAQVRVITFGGPRVGGAKFDWAFSQLVDLPYVWVTASDNRTVDQRPSGPLVTLNATRVIPEGNATADGQPGSIQYYATLLNNTLKANGSAIPITVTTNFTYGYLPTGRDSEFVASAAPQGGGFFSTVKQTIGAVGDAAVAGGAVLSEVFGGFFGKGSSPAPSPGPSDFSQLAPSGSSGSALNTGGGVSAASVKPSGSCQPILCKLKPAVIQACAAYGDGATLGPGSITVSNATSSTQVAVAWNAQTHVATFSWRGSQETEDWVQDLKLKFATDSSSEYFTELYTGSKLYDGELDQFRAVTDLSSSAATNIRGQLEAMAGGATPARVDCVGHSLGAGVATICGPWAAEVWPTADIRVVNFGSPKAGNMQFSESVYATVGRIYRSVNALDAVPSLPPFPSYLHSSFGIWLNSSKVITDDRPPIKINALTWNDHGCDDKYTVAIENAANVTIPSWVMKLS